MRPFAVGGPGNPASAHQAGRRVRQVLEAARERLALLLDAYPDEVIFTSGATEANNLAVQGLAGEEDSGHLIASPIEHPSVTSPILRLADRGFSVDWLVVDSKGLISADSLTSLPQPNARLIAVQLANHEMGAIQPIQLLTRSQTANFHCDAVQAVGKVPVRFHELGVTSLSLSAHKFHGPAGIGALLLRRGTKLTPLSWGGHQQQGRRPGTEPVALAVGLVTALELAIREIDQRREHVLRLRRRLLDALQAQAAPVVLNGPDAGGIPHTLNLSFPGCASDSLLMNLDLAGVACSTGSACSSGSLLPSPVLQAMGVPTEVLHSAIRFSFSFLTTEQETDEAAAKISTVVKRLRQLSDQD